MTMTRDDAGAGILMVEDNPDNATLVTWMLEDEGYEVVCAESAEKGLELLADNQYAVVLMDISLPGMNGKEAIRAIRADPERRHIPIVALTAHAILNERDAIMASGADLLITKPIDEDELIGTIAALVGKGRCGAEG